MRSLVVIAVSFILAPAVQASTEITPASVIAAMNAYRAGEGLAPLREDPRLVLAASDRIRDMEELAYWSHDSPDGRAPFVWLRPRGYDYQFAGENLAAGFETTEVLVSSWMESHGHRENILSPLYRDCGISIVEGSTKGRATGVSVVVLFGRSR